jgi:hypothetical protein
MELVFTSPCPGVYISVVEVAASLWAVFDVTVGTTVAVGHIERTGTLFSVALEAEKWEPYSFTTLDQSVEWFVEYCFAMSLGSATTPDATASTRNRAVHEVQTRPREI